MAVYRANGATSPDAEAPKKQSPKQGKNKKQQSPKKKRRNTVLNILLVVAVLVFAFSVYMILNINSEYKGSRDEYETLETDYVALPDPDADDPNNPNGYLRVNYGGLEALNSDFVCWLEVPNTVISYPVVWYSDNDYYLRRTFNKQSANSGVIFIDARSPKDFGAKNVVFHGHRMNDGSMFAALSKYMDQSYYNDHSEIRVYTSDGIYVYEVFSALKLNVNDENRFYRFSFDDEQDFDTWVRELKAASVYDTGVAVSGSDRIITLSTCVFGNEDERYVVYGVLKDKEPNPA